MIPGGSLCGSWRQVACVLEAGCVIPGYRLYAFGRQVLRFLEADCMSPGGILCDSWIQV